MEQYLSDEEIEDLGLEMHGAYLYDFDGKVFKVLRAINKGLYVDDVLEQKRRCDVWKKTS